MPYSAIAEEFLIRDSRGFRKPAKGSSTSTDNAHQMPPGGVRWSEVCTQVIPPKIRSIRVCTLYGTYIGKMTATKQHTAPWERRAQKVQVRKKIRKLTKCGHLEVKTFHLVSLILSLK